MTHWEFLLQKQGDRAWLPLESASAEILEGYYRIVVRSQRIDVPVEVQVSQVQTADPWPQRRTRKRLARTNHNGMLAIIPFTKLEPGLWEFRCANDLMSDFVGERWQYTIQLHVLAQDGEGDEAWDDEMEADQSSTWSPDFSPPATLSIPEETLTSATESPAIAADETEHTDQFAEPPTISPAASVAALRSLAERLSEEVLADTFAALEPALSAAPDAEAAAASVPTGLMIQGRSLALVLDPDLYTLSERHWIHLTGRVDWLEAASPPSERPTTTLLMAATLTVKLFDPQTSQLLSVSEHPLPAHPVPLPVTVEVAVPWLEQTYLVLGEASVAIQHQGQLHHLAPASFTITLDADQLLDAIANQAEEHLQFALEDEAATAPVASSPSPERPPLLTLDWSALTTQPLTGEQPDLFQPAMGMGLPPLLARSPKVDQPTQVPQLPTLPPLPLASPPPAEATSPLLTDATSAIDMATSELQIPAVDELSAEADEALTATDESAPSTATADPAEAEDPVEAAIDPQSRSDEAAIANPDAPWPDPTDIPPTPWADPEAAIAGAIPPLKTASGPPAATEETRAEPDSPAPESSTTASRPDETTAAFQSLNLQGRFFSRLTALANLAVESAEPPPSPTPAPVPPPEELPPVVTPPEPEPPPFAVWQAQQAALERQQREAELIAAEVVIYDEPIVNELAPAPLDPLSALAGEAAAEQTDSPLPSPQLDVPSGTLTAGEVIRVQVTVPLWPSRIYVKFWLTDRQTRTILEPLRWIADFSPDGQGGMTAGFDLTVPLGCLEIWLEGATVEVATQRQSQKQSLYRAIVPADLPASDWDEFEV